MRGKAKKLLVLVLTLSLVATFIAPLPVAKANGAEPPSEVWVDDDWKGLEAGSTVEFNDTTATIGENAFATIQEAINKVATGGTIYVQPGLYAEKPTINKPVTLEGAKAGVDPTKNDRTPTATTEESVIDVGGGYEGIQITSSSVTIDGFVVRNSTYFVVQTDYKLEKSNIKLTNNIFQGRIQPYKVNDLELSHNLANGIEIWYSTGTIIDNSLIGTIAGIGVMFSHDLTVKSNKIEAKTGTTTDYGIYIQGSSTIIVSDNEISGFSAGPRKNYTYGTSGAAVNIYASSDVKVEHNIFHDNSIGVLVEKANEDPKIVIISNVFKEQSEYAVLNCEQWTGSTHTFTPATPSAIIDASGNYWGSADGPFGATLAGPIVIYDWYADEQMTDLVSLDSVATKVPAHGSTGVALNAEVKLVFNYPVEMVSEPSITIGSLSNVSASLADDKKTVVITHPPFAYGTSYTVNVPEGTFYAKIEKEEPVPLTALNAVAIDGPTVFNRAFSWSFTTAARPLPPPPPPPEEPTPPGAEEPLPDSAIEEAISEAEETGEVVLSAPEGEDTLALTLDQLAIIGETEKPVVVNIGEVQMELPAAVVSNLAELTGAQVEIKVAELSSTAAEELHGQATNADQYKLAGTIFEITMELVKSDGSREDITDLGGKVKVYVPVPSDKQELAAAGLLTVARFNENTEAWEEIPSTFDEDTKCMIFETTHFSKYAVLEKVLDTAAPTVVNTDPVDNATNVPIDKVIKVTFNEDVVSATNFDKITLADTEGATVAVTTTLTAGVLTITPSDPLDYSTEYTVTIPAGAVKDAAGNLFAKDFSFSFTTKIVPMVVSTDPVDNATNVPIDKAIKVTFNEDVVSATNFDKITLADAKGATVAVTTTLTASVLTITPSDPLAYSTEYTVTIPAGAVKDTADNPLPEDVSFSFTTMAEPDTTAPEVESTDPANGAVGVPLDKVIKVIFNEDIVEGDAFADIVLKNAEGKEISTKVEISDSDLTIRPNARFEYSTKYTVTIPAGAVKDVAGNPLKEAYTFSFTTVGLPTQTFDDIQGHWAQHDIELMAGLGIAKGVGDNKFNPDGSVTRAEFVALLVRSLDVPVEPVSETSFKDVPPDAWFAAEVEAAHKVGIAIGFEDGTFRPYAQVTREQIAAFIVRAMNWTVEEEEVDALLSRFTDQAKISSWAKKEVAAAVQKGIVLGRPDGTFDPQANATRAEAVVMLKRVLQAAGVIPPNV